MIPCVEKCGRSLSHFTAAPNGVVRQGKLNFHCAHIQCSVLGTFSRLWALITIGPS